VSAIARDIHRAAAQLGIAVTGGHTEVSAAVRQPIVAGDMQGLVKRDALVTSSGARIGDSILLTKTAGIEGTSILARSFRRDAERILGRRMARRAARYHRVPGISVVEDALIAARAGATAMHDPTEGGVAAGLYELSIAAGKKLVVDLDSISIAEPTKKLCGHFGLRPLGLIGSGALLATIAPARLKALLRAWRRRGIAAAVIGEVAAGRGVEARSAGKRVRFEWSEKDELTKLGC
jgi:hydrogenase maturation factor